MREVRERSASWARISTFIDWSKSKIDSVMAYDAQSALLLLQFDDCAIYVDVGLYLTASPPFKAVVGEYLNVIGYVQEMDTNGVKKAPAYRLVEGCKIQAILIWKAGRLGLKERQAYIEAVTDRLHKES